jgi:hypothetical protein
VVRKVPEVPSACLFLDLLTFLSILSDLTLQGTDRQTANPASYYSFGYRYFALIVVGKISPNINIRMKTPQKGNFLRQIS